MPEIYTIIDGLTPIAVTDLNQFKDALSNTLGITDTAPANLALGKLVLPQSANALATPSPGAMYIDTAAQIMRIYSSLGMWRDYGPIRQVIRKNVTADVSIFSGSPVDIVSEQIQTSGGSVLILISLPFTINPDNANDGAKQFFGPYIHRNGAAIASGMLTGGTTSATTAFRRAPQYCWLDTAIRGIPSIYTYLVRGMTGTFLIGSSFVEGDASGLGASLTLIELN